MILTEKLIAEIEASGRSGFWFHSLIASHREATAQLAAATKRADDAERERDAALAVLRDVEFVSYSEEYSHPRCPCCLEAYKHTPSCDLAACLKGGA